MLSFANLVLRFLSLSDLAKVARVCRTWCWYLWREIEQKELWMPRICYTLRQYPAMTALRLTRIIHSMMLKRALTFESLNDCLTSLQQIEDAEREELLIEAHGIFQANLFDDLLQGFFDYRLKTERIRVAPSTQLQVKFNDASILTCYHGSFENDCIKRGHMMYVLCKANN